MSSLPAYIKKLTPMQQLTCEAMASNPNIGTNEVAKLVNISPETVRKYKRNPPQLLFHKEFKKRNFIICGHKQNKNISP